MSIYGPNSLPRFELSSLWICHSNAESIVCFVNIGILSASHLNVDDSRRAGMDVIPAWLQICAQDPQIVEILAKLDFVVRVYHPYRS